MMNNPKKITTSIREEINQIDLISKNNLYDAVRAYFRLFESACTWLSEEAGIHFVSLFSRLAFMRERYGLSKILFEACHVVRKKIETGISGEEELNRSADLVRSVLLELVTEVDGENSDTEALEKLLLPFHTSRKESQKTSFTLVEGLIVGHKATDKALEFIQDDESGQLVLVKYDILGKNDRFTQNIQAALKLFPLPISVNLIDVEETESGEWIPSAFVISPDYLVDVTTIASVQGDPWLYVLQKFKPQQTSPALMVGNAVNFFLDKLIKSPDLKLSDLYQELFGIDTLAWVLFDDTTVEEILQKLKLHFDHLQRVIVSDFPRKGINQGKIYLEPTFYCRDFGIQGRLDLFHINDERSRAEIIELKSSKPFKPNKYGISHSHYIQTILYEMIIQSTFQGHLKSTNYILYSVLEQDNLKPAQSIRELRYEILKTRNEIVAIEFGIAQDKNLVSKVFSYLSVDNLPEVRGFLQQDLKLFGDVYASLDEIEKAYLQNFTHFIAREHLLAKTGEHGVDKANGLSALWLESMDEKAERFGIYNHLQITKNDSEDALPVITLKKTRATVSLANFRTGDIAVLYPHQHNRRQVLHHEIFKCTILKISEDEITVRMRHPQLNQHLFKTTAFWNLEVDVLDSSFRHMYKNLFEFAAVAQEKRALLLGRKKPSFNGQEVVAEMDDSMTSQQKMIVRKILETKDYLLLWGPPGTGKTSVIIRQAAYHLHRGSEEKVIYLAYTNRAVDEICDALSASGLKSEFIRIGSRYSVAENYVENLLDEQLKSLATRAQILDRLDRCKIYVSTISSLQSKAELFDLMQFRTAIIDEASQILEPQLIGLLTKFERFILIGDHKQLPAVVAQNHVETIIEDEGLIKAGIRSKDMSFFERLYRQCTSQGWNHVLEILSQQGRMHEELMQFPAERFYENKLKLVPGVARLTRSLPGSGAELLTNRMLYLNTPPDSSWQWKINHFEADVICEIITGYVSHYQENQLEWKDDTLGVIVPYKAQIALIKSKLADSLPEITIDTVERYQGGARDIILYGVCTNRKKQMETLVSLNEDGLDRKLNVAVTRARERFILIGNEDILRADANYSALIDVCTRVDVSKLFTSVLS